MNTVIRQAIESDLAAVQKLSKELFESEQHRDPLLNMQWTYQQEGEEHFKKRVSGEEGVCFVAEISGEVVGYTTGSVMRIVSWRPVRRVEMENLIVSDSYRGQGIGEKLAERLVEWAKEQGVERIMVSAYAANDGAIKFYKRNGFVPDSIELEKEI